jgi:hypothetical protein
MIPLLIEFLKSRRDKMLVKNNNHSAPNGAFKVTSGQNIDKKQQ